MEKSDKIWRWMLLYIAKEVSLNSKSILKIVGL